MRFSFRALGGLIEVLIIRRFANAPRLILAVATIGLAQVLNGLAILIPVWWTGQSAERFDTPFRMSFTISPVVMNGNYVLAIVAVPGQSSMVIGPAVIDITRAVVMSIVEARCIVDPRAPIVDRRSLVVRRRGAVIDGCRRV